MTGSKSRMSAVSASATAMVSCLARGTVGVDEMFIGARGRGYAAGVPQGRKSLVGIAVEIREPKGTGPCRMAILQDAPASVINPGGPRPCERWSR